MTARGIGLSSGLSLGGGVMIALAGCGSSETIELVAIRGCGLDQEFSSLRVRVLGDFPASAGDELLLGPSEQGTIPALPEDATGVAAEGLFGTTVTAIGRSHGIDPDLASGRVAGVDAGASVLPVFFAAPDSLCELDLQPSARTSLLGVAVGAVGEGGDVLLVGGLDALDEPSDEIVHVDLFSGEVRVLSERMPGAVRGHSVHGVDGRRFVVLGGAGSGVVSNQRVEVDVSGQGSVLTAGPIVVAGEAIALAHHATATHDSSTRALIAGGCDQVDGEGGCDPGSAFADTWWFDARAPDASEALPPLTQARFDAHAVVSGDGVAYVAGGFGSDGVGLGSVERLLPGQTWAIVHALEPNAEVAGLAVLDGGLILLSERSGTIHWWSEAGSGILDPTSRAPPLEPVMTTRPMFLLPGERVLVDTWLFSPGTAGVDPAAERVELAPGPEHRSGALMLGLLDGSVIVAGGRASDTNEVSAAPLLRLRPRLDGPDEWIPDLAGPQTDAFVTNSPGSATVVVGGLRLDANDSNPDALPPVRAHVRGFRSASLRLEFSFDDAVGGDGASAHLVLSQGASSLVAIALHEGGVVVRSRAPDGELSTLDCGLDGVSPGQKLVLELDADQLRLDGPEGPLAMCTVPGSSKGGVAVGFGVSGSGSARFFGLRLARR